MTANFNAKAINKANKDFEKEADLQFKILFPIFVIALWNQGKRNTAIARRLVEVGEIWHECAQTGAGKSMLQMMEEETGIEMMLDGELSYHNFEYLDGTRMQYPTMTVPQWICMRQKMKRWLPVQLEACFGLAMHRYDGYGFQRLSELLREIDELRKEFGRDYIAVAKKMEALTGFSREEILPR